MNQIYVETCTIIKQNKIKCKCTKFQALIISIKVEYLRPNFAVVVLHFFFVWEAVKKDVILWCLRLALRIWQAFMCRFQFISFIEHRFLLQSHFSEDDIIKNTQI